MGFRKTGGQDQVDDLDEVGGMRRYRQRGEGGGIYTTTMYFVSANLV
jgi:hypothetical protein